MLHNVYCYMCCDEPPPPPPPPGHEQTKQCEEFAYLGDTATGFSDGSPTDAYYERNLQCSWIINTGYAPIELTFTRFDTEAGYDFVTVYEYAGESQYGVHTWEMLSAEDKLSGSNLPPVFRTTGERDALLVTFTSDGLIQGKGFYATYRQVSSQGGSVVSIVSPPPPPPPPPPQTAQPRYCSASTVETAATGEISLVNTTQTVSSTESSSCSWIISPG